MTHQHQIRITSVLCAIGALILAWGLICQIA